MWNFDATIALIGTIIVLIACAILLGSVMFDTVRNMGV